MRSHFLRMTTTVLVLAVAGAVAGQSAVSVKERLGVIMKRQHAARERFSNDLKGKTPEVQKAGVERYAAETDKNTEEALGLAQANPTEPADVEALEFVIRAARAGPGDHSYRAMEILLHGHVRDPGMGQICGRIFYFVHEPVAEALIRSVLKEHPNRSDRARACHALASYLMYQAKMIRRIREKPATIDEYVHERHKAATARFVKEADPNALDRQAEALLERVVAEFADVPDWYDKRPLGAIAEGELFAVRHLSVGKLAPEVVGRDHEGKLFALAEYRGKVVVLTFSGNWCGPCAGMYPQERELAARHAGKPFTLLSVNTDASLDTLRESIAKGQITWRCWWDGGMTGPITTRWGIRLFPSIFVLDRTGVIRFKDLRGDELDRAVTSLLDEAAVKTPAR
ncbi:MAG: TlpA disulfide reductase family protein [Isosphaeraceae bacterium]